MARSHGQSGRVAMDRMFRIKVRMRRFKRQHPRIAFAIRSFMIFSATFGGAYGFVSGSRSENSAYDPHAFAIGASFLFALAGIDRERVGMLVSTSVSRDYVEPSVACFVHHHLRLASSCISGSSYPVMMMTAVSGDSSRTFLTR